MQMRGQARLWCIGIIAIALLAQAPGCAEVNQAAQSSPGQPVLRVGVSANAAPMIFRQAGEYTGIEAELARVLAAELGMGLQFVDCPWDDLIPKLLEGRFDIIMSGMTITRERSVLVAFTDPYIQVGQRCLVRNESMSKFPSIGAVQYTSARVGAEKGTTGDFLVQRELTLAKKETFASAEKGAKALMAGRIDLLVTDGPIAWWLAAVYESSGLTTLPFFLTQERLAWAVRKDNTQLAASASRILEGWKQSGQLKKTLQRWLPRAF